MQNDIGKLYAFVGVECNRNAFVTCQNLFRLVAVGVFPYRTQLFG